MWAANLAHSVLELFPGPVRRFVWRRAFGSCGREVFIDHKVYVKFPWLVFVGDHVSLNRGCEFYPDLSSGSTITLGADVYVAPNVRFHASGHDIGDLERHIGGDIRVGNGCWIGAGATVLPGVVIGAGSVVGAGAVVARDVPERVVVAGVPARIVNAVER